MKAGTAQGDAEQQHTGGGKKVPHKPSLKPDPNQISFVSCNLTEDQKPVLRQWADANEDDLLKHIASLVSGGYRLSLKEDKNGYNANLAPMRENSPNKGRILQEWGSTPERALLKLVWAHLRYFELMWPAGREEPKDDW